MLDSRLKIEQLETKRIKYLTLNLLSFFAWNGSRIADHYLMLDSNPILLGINILGWLVWVISLVMIVTFSKRISRDRKASQILNDEWTRMNRMKAFRGGFIAVCISLVALIILSLKWELSGGLVGEMALFMAILAAMSTFLYYNRINHA